MARPLRIEYSGAAYHVTSRGNEMQDVFRDDEDRRVFLDILAAVNRRYNWVCHGYCLMGNHYHLLIETPDANLSMGMRQLNGVYTQAFNRRHRRAGHLFQGRYKAILIEKESLLLEVSRYIVLNPVRSGLTKGPEKWQWSSYRAMAGEEVPHEALTTKWIWGRLGSRQKSVVRAYREFVAGGVSQGSMWKGVIAQALLGSEAFVRRHADYLKSARDLGQMTWSQRFANRPKLESIFSGPATKDKRERDKKIVEATERYGYRQKDVADHLGMHFSSVSRILSRYERSREGQRS
jgi:putative transposase